MFYLKITENDEVIEIDIHGDEIYTRCFNCGKEIQVDEELLIEVLKDGDLSSTSIACCNSERPQLIRIK